MFLTRIAHLYQHALLALACMLLAACAGTPDNERPAPGAKAAHNALKMIGKPYRFGGATPRGFDCSGLVYYSYHQAGAKIPRTTHTQRAQSRRIPTPKKGDLVFFNQEGKRASHVGIYIGNGHFVHAPSSGKRVRKDSLSDPYWRRHFAEARRF